MLAAFRARLATVGLADADVRTLRNATGMDMPADSQIVRRAGAVLARLGLDPTPQAKPTSTEGGVFARMGAQSIVLGPSLSIGNAHTPNEYANLEQVALAINVYEAMIREFCSAPC